MKKNIRVLLLVISVLVISTHLYAEAPKKKIGYADLQAVFMGYYKTKKSDEAIAKLAEEKEKDKDKLAEELKKLQDESALLSKSEKEKKQSVIEDKQKKLLDFNRAAMDELNRKRDSEGRDILIEIGRGITEYGEKNNYDMILDARTMFYANEDSDLTDDIIEFMNSKR